MPPRLLLATLLLPLLAAGTAHPHDTDFQAVRPEPQVLDWVRMSSGEWLRGEIIILRDDDFEFDSEDLDELDLDWDDVVEFISPRTLTWIFEDRISYTGSGYVRGDEIVIRLLDGEEQRMSRTLLLGILEGKPTEWNFWSGLISFGFVGRAGNTNQLDFTTIIRLRRNATLTRLFLDYEGNMGELEDETSVNNHRAGATLDFLIYRNFFVTAPALEYYADQFQNVDYRITANVSAGLYVIRNNETEWTFSLGAGYQKQVLLSVAEGASPEGTTSTIVPAMTLEWEITGDIDFSLDYSAQVGVPDPKNSFQHAVGLLSIELWSIFDFDTSVTWDYTENPQAGADEIVPERSDFRTAVGLGVDW